MDEKSIRIRIAARCEAAGRPNNEDNFVVCDRLSEQHWGFTADEEVDLGQYGSLLVVCDGMGGMNAGEVASEIAVRTLMEEFGIKRLCGIDLDSDKEVQKFICAAIQAADAAIKRDGNDNPEHEGMGSTVVLAWLLGEKVYVGWCGDSRCYRYNPRTGLERLSHDHSYVQELVDAGKLTEELAFDHPNSNIITRSLGDPRGKAQPDTKVFYLRHEDIILLCSDGLCGCLRDEEIEAVVRDNQTSMQTLRDALWEADRAAGWHDNVTIALAQVVSGAQRVTTGIAVRSNATLVRSNRRLRWLSGLLLLLLLLTLGCAAWLWRHYGIVGTDDGLTAVGDTCAIAEPDTLKVPEEETEKQPKEWQSPKSAKQKDVPKDAGEQPALQEGVSDGKVDREMDKKIEEIMQDGNETRETAVAKPEEAGDEANKEAKPKSTGRPVRPTPKPQADLNNRATEASATGIPIQQ